MSEVTPEFVEPASADLSDDDITEVLREQYGLSGQVFPIDGRQDPYFLIDNGHMRYLLKVAPADTPPEEIDAEHAVMRHILRSPDGPPVPEPVATREEAETAVLLIGGDEKRIRLLTFLDGSSPPMEPLADKAIAAIGTISAALAKSLADFEHPALEREPPDDLRKAGPRTIALLSSVSDQAIRDAIAKPMVAALRRIQPLGPALRITTTHQNLDAEAIIGEADAGTGLWLPTGVTDFTGISKGWLVAGFANTCAWIFANRDGDADALLPAIRAYHDIHPMSLAELEALWPLIVARTGIMTAEAENRRARVPDDPEAQEGADNCRALLAAAGAVSPAVMFASILDATGMEIPEPRLGRLLPEIDPDTIRLVDLSVTSPLLYGGNWTDPENDWKLLARIAWETGRASTRYGEYRLSRSSTDPDIRPESFALHIDVCVPAGTPVVAPFAGTLKTIDLRLVLSNHELALHVEGLDCALPDDTELSAGDSLGNVSGAENSTGGLRLRLCRDPEIAPPLFCTLEKSGIWSRLCPSPSRLLGIDADAPRPDHPEHFIRGWKEFLFDATGRTGLDFSGTAPLVGHGHPRLAAAVYRQSLLLGSNPSGTSEAQDTLRQRLAGTDLDEFSPILVVTPPKIAAALLENGTSPVTIASALATLDVIEDEDLMNHARQTGAHLREKLEELADRFPEKIRLSGNGLMLDLEPSADVKDLGNRLRAYVMTAEGPEGQVLLRPPLCVSRLSIDSFVSRLEGLLSET